MPRASSGPAEEERSPNSAYLLFVRTLRFPLVAHFVPLSQDGRALRSPSRILYGEAVDQQRRQLHVCWSAWLDAARAAKGTKERTALDRRHAGAKEAALCAWARDQASLRLQAVVGAWRAHARS